MHYVHDLIAGIADGREARELWDLGCGVGGSIVYLATRLEASFVGVTISGVQADLAGQILEQRGLTGRCRVSRGSYLDSGLLSGGDHPRVFYAIESFVHGPDPEGFFAATATAAHPGDTLLICDDFLSDEPARQDRWVAEYRQGWRISSLLTPEETRSLAQGAGWEWEGSQDLTGWVETGRLRDRIIRVVTALARPIRPSGAFWDNLFGGNALQACLRRGLVRYLFFTLRWPGR
jgi:hypothetical protein